MDKESFQTQTDMDDFVSQLPVPNQLPKTPDLSHIPTDILRSSTVETLIHQNEDLLSRLSISLRRNSSLEEIISQLEKQNRILTHKHSNTQDQLQVYKKKDELIEGRYSQYEAQVSQLKKDLRLFETQYTELYSTSQSRISELKEKIAYFSKRIGRFSRFRKRIVKLYRDLQKNIEIVEQENQRLLSELSVLTNSQKAMKENMSSAIERLQQVDRENKKNLSELTSNYENQLDDAHKTVQNQNLEISKLKSDLSKANSAYQKNVDLENQLVLLDRKMMEQKQRSSAEMTELQKNLYENRSLAKQKVLEVQSLQEQVQENEEENHKLKNENKRLEDQIESLQTLWRDNNEQLEGIKQKYTSLQKLNQQISITLNDTRKQLKLERDQKETLNFRAKDKIRQLESQIQLLSTQVTSDDKGAEFARIQPKVIHHIQSLIAEVQSGVDSAPIVDESVNSSPDA